MDDIELSEKPLSTATKTRLVEHYHRLIYSLARKAWTTKYGRRFGSVEDWYQEAVIAAIEAAELFDVSRGVKYSSFAFRWISCRMMKRAAEAGLIRVARRGVPEDRQEENRTRARNIQNYPPGFDLIWRDDPPREEYDASDAMKRLRPAEVELIRRYYGFDGERVTLKVIAGEMGFTINTVRVMAAKVRRKLRAAMVG